MRTVKTADRVFPKQRDVGRPLAGSGSFPLSPTGYVRLMLGIIGVLFVCNFAGTEIAAHTNTQPLKAIAGLAMMDHETSVPTLFNYLLILINAMLLGVIANRSFAVHDRWRWHWVILCAIFLLLSYDEAAQLHERLSSVGAHLVEAKGIFRFAWIVPMGAAVTVFSLGFLNFLLHRPRQIAGLMIVSGAIYVMGAMGIEMLGGLYVSAHGMAESQGSVGFELLCGVEESLEMLGMALFGFTLLTILEQGTQDTRNPPRA